MIKIVADAESDKPNAGDVFGEAVIAVWFGLRAQELVSTLHPYLTWGEGLKLAAQTFTKGRGQAVLLCVAQSSGMHKCNRRAGMPSSH